MIYLAHRSKEKFQGRGEAIMDCSSPTVTCVVLGFYIVTLPAYSKTKTIIILLFFVFGTFGIHIIKLQMQLFSQIANEGFAYLILHLFCLILTPLFVLDLIKKLISHNFNFGFSSLTIYFIFLPTHNSLRTNDSSNTATCSVTKILVHKVARHLRQLKTYCTS